MNTREISKVKIYFDDTSFVLLKNEPEVKMIAAVILKDEKEFYEKSLNLSKNFSIPDDIELKWNLDTEIREQIGQKKYDEYKAEFMSLIVQNSSGYIGVSQSSKKEALEHILKNVTFPEASFFIFDNDLIENTDNLPSPCTELNYVFASSSEEFGLQAADYIAGVLKLMLQQNSGIHSKTHLIKDGMIRIPVEFIIKMQTRWMMTGPIQENENGLPFLNTINSNVFLGPDLSPNIRSIFENNFTQYYMGCFH